MSRIWTRAAHARKHASRGFLNRAEHPCDVTALIASTNRDAAVTDERFELGQRLLSS
jgi:hypothetical protein